MTTGSKQSKPLVQLRCVLEAGDTAGFMREVIATAQTELMRHIDELAGADIETITRAVCETTADVVLRRMYPDMKAELTERLVAAHLPALLKKHGQGDSQQ